MRKVILPSAFLLGSTLVACSFQMHAGSDPQHPPPPTATATPATTTPTAHPSVLTGRGRIGHRSSGTSGPTPTPTSTTTTPAPTPTTPVPSGGQVVAGSTIFGNGTVDPNGFKGSIYWVAAGTTKIPALASMTPNGYLFTSTINTAPQAFTGGFPGIDPAHNQNFAIRYEAPLVVTTEADYDFRLVADDGAVLNIDSTPIVDNDGAKAAPAEKTGPVHLVAGTHLIQLDYFQTTGNVAVQLFCKKANDVEKLCPTHL